MTIYVINSNHHFFEVHAPVDNGALQRAGCEIVANKALMYESVVATTGQELGEIEGGEFVVKHNDRGNLICIESRGFTDNIEGSLEAYISDYEM